jgi:hypothetical protein
LILRNLLKNLCILLSIEVRGEAATLMYDYETDSGEYEWTGITFEDTLEYKHTSEKEINVYLVNAYNSVVEVKNSNQSRYIEC